MPAVKYDYDYYEYVNGHRVSGNLAYSTKSKSAVSPQKSSSANYKTATKKTSVNTKPKGDTTSSRKNGVDGAKKVVTKTNSSCQNKTVQKKTKKNNIDIPIKSKSNIANKPKPMTLKKPKSKIDYSYIKSLVLKVVGIVSFFLIAFFICYRYSLINEQFVKLRNIKKDYATVQTVNSQIQADIESKTDLTYIENYAKYQLGMQKPSGSQVQYVTVEKKDKIMSPVVIEEEEDLGLFNKVCSKIYDLFK